MRGWSWRCKQQILLVLLADLQMIFIKILPVNHSFISCMSHHSNHLSLYVLFILSHNHIFIRTGKTQLLYMVRLNQCKTTISVHLLGSSVILKVFIAFLTFSLPFSKAYPMGVLFSPRNVFMPYPSILWLKFICVYSSSSCTYIFYYNFFIPFPNPKPNPFLLYPEGPCQYNFRWSKWKY